MHFRSKWTMRRHFRHLHFKIFSMVFCGPIWCLFVFSIKTLNIQNFCTNTTLKVGVHLGAIGFNLLRLPPTCQSVFHSQTHFLSLKHPCTPHLITNLMLGLWHSRSCIKCGSYFFIIARWIFNIKIFNATIEMCTLVSTSVGSIYIISS
jgi:hypothetical protein